jgi:hypothetical protein
MRSTRSLLTILIAAVVVMLGLLSAPAAATEEPLPIPKLPTLDPTAEPAEAPENLLGDGNVEGVYDENGNLQGYFDENGNYVTVDAAASAESLAASCWVDFYGDYVHVSSGDASGHGRWDTSYACRYGYSEVSVGLYEYYSDGTWRQKASGKGTVRPYNYYKQQVTARRDCDNTRYTSWRSLVSGSTNFRIDGYYVGGWEWTPIRSIYCRVS